MSALSNKAFAAVLTAALGAASVAMAEQPMQIEHPIPGGHSNVAACAAGFTASPATIDASNPYGQGYTCTGPTIVCSAHFSPQDPVVGTIPPAPGQLLGSPVYGSPVTIKGGRMVYSCAEPQAPPK